MKIDLFNLDAEGMYRFLERIGMLCGTGPASQDDQQIAYDEAVRCGVTVSGGPDVRRTRVMPPEKRA